MAPSRIDPWNSSAAVGLRTARPAEAFSVQSCVAFQASAAFGETPVSTRSPNPTVLTAFDSSPPNACQRSPRAPKVAFHRGANRHVSCAYRLCNRVLPLKAETADVGAPPIQSALPDTRVRNCALSDCTPMSTTCAASGRHTPFSASVVQPLPAMSVSVPCALVRASATGTVGVRTRSLR